MSKSGKRRFCPAAGREITSAECGEHRGSKYSCPATCGFSPLAPANYSQLLELEGTVDKKTAEWLFATAPDRPALDAGMRAVQRSKSGHAHHAFFVQQIFFVPDTSGRTCAQRWEAAGFTGLKNDERVLLSAKMGLRVALIEIHRILDDQSVEAVDLLAENPRPFTVVDRTMASHAVRFAPYLCWAYTLPHFWRMHGTAIVIPDYLFFEAKEIVTEIAGHLGGPQDEAGLRHWLAMNFERFEKSLKAVDGARHRMMFEGMDANFGKAVYELRRPFAECREVLDAEPAVDEDQLSDSERDEGFAEARAWFTDAATSPVALPKGGRPLLGRILLGQAHWRLEAMGAEKLAALRAAFERILGARVQFTGERLDNIGVAMAEKHPAPDPALVPPRLLGNPQRIVLSSSRIEKPRRASSKQDLEAEIFEAQDRGWLDHPVEALDGQSPRSAAAQPGLRAKLIRLMKSRVRGCDERNLRSGSNYDVNWMLRELGLDEITFPAPHQRAIPAAPACEDNEDWDEDAAAVWPDPELPPAPPLPAEPFSALEVAERLRIAMGTFETAEEAMEEMTAAGSTLIEDTDEITVGLIDDQTFTLLIPFLIQTWFVFVPPGTSGPEIEFHDFEAGIRGHVEMLVKSLTNKSPEEFLRFLNSGPQPDLMLALTGMLFDSISQLPKKNRPSPEQQAAMASVLAAVVAEMDAACRAW